jgi:hypothetical protein
MHLFWAAIQEDPIDLVGIRHHLTRSLRRTPTLLNTSLIQDTFRTILESKDPTVKLNILRLMSEVPITDTTPNLLSAILAALLDDTEGTRSHACKFLRNLGPKAATSEVIVGLVDAIGDRSAAVRQNACEALGKMGEKTTTSGVIAALRVASAGVTHFWSNSAVDVMVRAMSVYGNMRELQSGVVATLVAWCMERNWDQWDALTTQSLIKIYLETANDAWLPLVPYVAVLEGAAVTLVGETIKIYDSNGVSELQVSHMTVRKTLLKAFNTEKTRLTGDFDATDAS